jgi:S-adenosylmethionine/arginine decarboxylase-like enzyme
MWAESGAQLYTWERFRAITVDVFSCKEFSIAEAVAYTRQALHAEQIAWKEIEPVLRLVATEDESVVDVSAAGV